MEITKKDQQLPVLSRSFRYHPKVPYSYHSKASLNARMLQSSRYRTGTGKKEAKAKKQKLRSKRSAMSIFTPTNFYNLL
ncbi:hypothetical protein ASJ81_11320 [Methanosarcina spelaei]|uniref:Uncharacterized protein n=1 Tax=Methanosarcina spelaei TaxID=1036679 RepID=A0A2A2HNV8_9EURY|nr:hypothetical protein ASJ81_11320 [Methanosarcina spelaei]